MVAISAPSTILLTGANGYIAGHVVKAFLDQGFSVRGTVRSAAKGEELQKVFAEYGERFQYFVIPDFNASGAFDKAVVDVDGIAHVSAPLAQVVDDLDKILKPSVEGTTALLESARKFGTAVKRVVLTSSIATVLEPKEGPYNYTEADWNESALALLKEKGVEAGPFIVYVASKILQERAAFDFMEAKKGSIAFDLVTIIPGWVVGPVLDNQEKPGSPSVSEFVGALTGKPAAYPLNEIVDVRDIAELHVRSLTTEAAAGQRFIASAGNFTWQAAYDAVNAIRPKPISLPEGIPDSTSLKLTYDNSKSRKVLNFEYRDTAKTVQDMWTDLVARGWIDQTVA